jgi:hypothetical protein
VNFSFKIFHFYFYALLIYLFFNVFVILQGNFLGINIFKIQMVEAAIVLATFYHILQLAFSKNVILVQEQVFGTQLLLVFSVFSSLFLIRFNYQLVYIIYVIYYMLLFFAINLSLFFVDSESVKTFD